MRHASLLLPLCVGFATRNGRFGTRADGTLHGDIHQRRFAGGEGAFEGRCQVLRAFDVLAMPSQSLRHHLVTARQQVGGYGTPVETELDLSIDTPGRVVSKN